LSWLPAEGILLAQQGFAGLASNFSMQSGIVFGPAIGAK
jgi:hypothetical protein